MLTDNYSPSKSRLVSLLSRLRNDPRVLKEYHAVIQEQVNAGVVERVEEDGPGEVGEVHYLAHHPVVCQGKQTTKVRVVYDASAKKSGGPSLNDCLYSGPVRNHCRCSGQIQMSQDCTCWGPRKGLSNDFGS